MELRSDLRAKNESDKLAGKQSLALDKRRVERPRPRINVKMARKDEVKSLFFRLFENPHENYQDFEETLRQAINSKKISTLSTILEPLNDILSGQSTVPENEAKTALEQFIELGFVEKLWQAFIAVVDIPPSADSRKTLLALLETISIISESSLAYKYKLRPFLPYLLRDVVVNDSHQVRLRLNALKFLNSWFGESTSVQQDKDELKQDRKIHEETGQLLSASGDFELQASLLELVFRLLEESERKKCISNWFEDENLQDAFGAINQEEFEAGCRRFLNLLNTSSGERQRVFSFPCLNVQIGDKQVLLAKDESLSSPWVDFNLGSKTITFFVEDEEESPQGGESLWETATIKPEDVWDHRLEKTSHRLLLRMKFKNPEYRLAPSIQPCGKDTLNIAFPLSCDLMLFKKILERMNVAPSIVDKGEYTPSPKASVCINTIHVGNRLRGNMTIVPTPTAKPPSVLLEGDHDEEQLLVPSTEGEQPSSQLSEKASEGDALPSDPKSIDRIPPESSTKESEIPLETSQPSGRSPAVKVGNVISDMRTIASDDNTPSGSDLRSETEKFPEKGQPEKSSKHDQPEKSPKHGSADNDSGDTSGKSRRSKYKTKERKDNKGGSSNGSDSTSGASSGKGRKKRALKSPLPVVVVQTRGKASSEANANDQPPEKKAKKYPSAFNVDKRMEKRRQQPEQSSQSLTEIKKKVFGTKGTAFGKRPSPTTLAPKRAMDPRTGTYKQKEVTFVAAPSAKQRRLSQPVFSSTSSSPDHNDLTSPGHDDNEREVIQDSLPIDSPENEIPARRRSSGDAELSRKKHSHRMTSSDSEILKHKATAAPKPKRLFKKTRKDGPTTRSAFVKEKVGVFSESSSSGTDWPGLEKTPGPVSALNLIPDKLLPSSHGKTKRRTRGSLGGRKKGKRTSISPALKAISEENTPGSKNGKEESEIDEPYVASDSDDSSGLSKPGSNEAPIQDEDIQKRSSTKAQKNRTPDVTNYNKGFHCEQTDKINDNLEGIESYPLSIMEGEEVQKVRKVNEREQDQHAGETCKPVVWQGEYDHEDQLSSGREEKEDPQPENKSEHVEQENSDRHKRRRQPLRCRKRNVSKADSDSNIIEDSYARDSIKSINTKKRQPSPLEKYDGEEELCSSNDISASSRRSKLRALQDHNKCLSVPPLNPKTAQAFTKDFAERCREKTPDEDVTYEEINSPVSPHQKQRRPKALAKAGRVRKGKSPLEFYTEEDLSPIQYHNEGKNTSQSRSSTPVESEIEETTEMLELRKLCEDITTLPSMTPKTPIGTTDPSRTCNQESGHLSRAQRQQRRRVTSPSRSQYDQDEDHDELRDGTNASHGFWSTMKMSERLRRASDDTCDEMRRSRLEDSGIGMTPGSAQKSTGLQEKRSGKSKSKIRRTGELQVTAFRKTPITPGTSAIMKRIDEEYEEASEDDQEEQNTKGGHKKRFFDWTSSGPSRKETTLHRGDEEEDDVDETIVVEEQKRVKAPSTTSHNPHIKPRTLFPERSKAVSREQYEDEPGYESGPEEETVRLEMNSMFSGLSGTIVKAMQRKRQNMKRFSEQTLKRAMDTINRYWERDQCRRDKLVKDFRHDFENEITGLERELEKNHKAEEQFLVRLEKHAKLLSSQRIIQENKIKDLQKMCTVFEKEMVRESQSHKAQQVSFRDELKANIFELQKSFLLEMQNQDRTNMRRSLETTFNSLL
ncbi:uncharacterized protein LOC116617532 isoform X2 [Nematostella vectensis]|uniref:uncharacterized protein LOC116617532 isoform X2 n=1 Tax=Nematostella vectensis TaxID=45351 RepID=UPI0013904027|nr:uncharacterized protein LOC116617532 isoform X2 [Nematostella vectensis]